jgi:phage shock protein E
MADYDLEDARELLDQGGVLLDVRTRQEYDALHVPGAIHVPTGAGPRGSLEGLVRFLPELLELVGYDRSRPVVLYCKLGKRAGRAKRMLEGMGFTNVTNLGGVDVEPMRSLIARGEPLFRRPPPDLRPILYQFFRDHPFVESGDAAWNPLAWSMGLETGAQAEQLAYQALGATLDVPGLGPFQPYRERALYDFTRGMIQQQTGGTAFQPWQGFQDGPPQGFAAGFVLTTAAATKLLGTVGRNLGTAAAVGYGLGARRRRTAEWRTKVQDYQRPPRPFPPGPWVIPPQPEPRFAPGHPWYVFAVQRFRDDQAPYAERRGAAFTRAVPLGGAGYSAGRRRRLRRRRALPAGSRFWTPAPPAPYQPGSPWVNGYRQ